MAITTVFIRCPGCGWPAIVPSDRQALHVDHRCLCCCTVYDISAAPILVSKRQEKLAGRARLPSQVSPAVPLPAPSPADGAASRLMIPHRCCHCEGELPATGRRHTTNCSCPHCHRPASVYAVLFHCPECDALLESPLRQVGAYGRCPVCHDSLIVPSDLLFNDDRVHPDHTWFAFACPGCRLRLQSPPSGANKTAVCPHCLHVLTVPAGGEAVVFAPLPAEKPLVPTPSEPQRRCGGCGLLTAARGRECHNCGAAMP